MDTTLAISALAIAVFTFLVALSTFVFSHFRSKASSELSERVTKLEIQVGLVWKVVEQGMSDILHSPAHEARDTLIEKNLRDELSNGEARNLASMLIDIKNDGSHSAGEQAAATWLLGVLVLKYPELVETLKIQTRLVPRM